MSKNILTKTKSFKKEKSFKHLMKLKKQSSKKKLYKKESLQTLAFIKSRHETILQILNNVDDLSHILLDAKILVDIQSEMINNIVDNCEEAKEYVNESLDVIQESKQLHKTSKYVCFLFFLLFLLKK